MTMAHPTAKAERKNKKGIIGEYQKGYNFSGIIKYKEPTDDWCKVERMTPAMTIGIIALWTHFLGLPQPNFSKIMGENSKAKTVV